MKKNKKTLVTTLYDGKSPKCRHCGSENTEYSREVEVPFGAMVDFSPNLLLVHCRECGKNFEVFIGDSGNMR